MRKIRDILRLRHEGGLSIRQVKAGTKVSIGDIQKRSMRQDHKAGEKCFVDYAGQTVPIVCASTT